MVRMLTDVLPEGSRVLLCGRGQCVAGLVCHPMPLGGSIRKIACYEEYCL